MPTLTSQLPPTHTCSPVQPAVVSAVKGSEVIAKFKEWQGWGQSPVHSSTAEGSDLRGPHTSSGLSGRREGEKEAGKEQDMYVHLYTSHYQG